MRFLYYSLINVSLVNYILMIIAFAYENVHSAAEFMLMGGRACECSFFIDEKIENKKLKADLTQFTAKLNK